MPLSEGQESLIKAAYDAIDAVPRGTVDRKVVEQYVLYCTCRG